MAIARKMLLAELMRECRASRGTTLAEMAQIKKQLGADGGKLQVLFVTLDPERDTQEALAGFVPAFDPSFVALRGTLSVRELATLLNPVAEFLSTGGKLRFAVQPTKPMPFGTLVSTVLSAGMGSPAQAIKDLGLKVVDWFVDYEGLPIACICQGIPRATLRQRLKASYPQTYKGIEFGAAKPKKIAILSGSGRSAGI